MDTLQDELDSTHPVLNIQLLGVNEKGLEFSNETVTEGRDLPWLQDVDADDNSISDVWYDLWDVIYRDVVILDGDNVKFATFNLTVNDLANQQHYDELRELLIDAAMYTQKPWQNADNPLDVDQNGFVHALDVLIVINRINSEGSGPLPPPTTELPPRRYDCSGDNLISALDAIQIINFINSRSETGGGAASEGEWSPQSAPFTLSSTADAATPVNADTPVVTPQVSALPLIMPAEFELLHDDSSSPVIVANDSPDRDSLDDPREADTDVTPWQQAADAVHAELSDDTRDTIPAIAEFQPLSAELSLIMQAADELL